MSRHTTSNDMLRARFGENKQNQQVNTDQPEDNKKTDKPDLKVVSKTDQVNLKEKISETLSEPNLEQPKQDQVFTSDQAKDQQNPDLGSANSAGPAEFADTGRQFASPAEFAGLAEFAEPVIVKELAGSAIFASLNINDGYTKIPNWIFDSLPNLVNTNEQLIYLHLYRLTHGFRKDQCLVSLEKLGERTGMSRRTVQDVVKSLIKKGLITRIDQVFGFNQEQGSVFRVAIPAGPADSARPAKSAHIKDLRNIKEIYKKEMLRLKHSNIGRNYTYTDLCEDLKRFCIRQEIKYNNDIYEKALEEIKKNS